MEFPRTVSHLKTVRKDAGTLVSSLLGPPLNPLLFVLCHLLGPLFLFKLTRQTSTSLNHRHPPKQIRLRAPTLLFQAFQHLHRYRAISAIQLRAFRLALMGGLLRSTLKWINHLKYRVGIAAAAASSAGSAPDSTIIAHGCQGCNATETSSRMRLQMLIVCSGDRANPPGDEEASGWKLTPASMERS